MTIIRVLLVTLNLFAWFCMAASIIYNPDSTVTWITFFINMSSSVLYQMNVLRDRK